MTLHYPQDEPSKDVTSRWLIYLLTAVPPLIALGLYSYVGVFNRLIGDSLCSFYFAERLGLLRSIWYWRLTWSGRYSAYAFDWLTLKALGARYIPLFIPLMLLVWIFTNILAIHRLMRANPYGNHRIYLPLVLGPLSVFLILATIPQIQQSFFWLDGFRAYTLPLILLGMILSIYSVFLGKSKSRPSLPAAALLAFFLFFVNGGFSETFAVFQVCLIAYSIAYTWLIRRPGRVDRILRLLFSGLLGAFFALAVIITAPGNAVRQSLLPSPPGPLDLIQISMMGYIDFLAGFLSPEKIAALLGAIAISAWAGSMYTGKIPKQKKQILLQMLGAILLSFSCFPPGVYWYAEPPPARVMIIPVSIMSALGMSTGFLAGNLLKQNGLIDAGRGRVLLLTAILFIVFSAWKNAVSIYDSRSVYVEYAERRDEVDGLITEARNRGEETVQIPPLTNWAQIEEPRQNPAFWVNQCYSAFYGILVLGPP